MLRLLLSFSFVATLWGQGGPAAHIITGPTKPALCSPLSGDVWVQTTGTILNATGVLNVCDTPNHWTAIVGLSASNVIGTANQVTVSCVAGACTLSIPTGFVFPGTTTFVAATTVIPSFRIPSGVAPTTPAVGAVWNLGGTTFQYWDGGAVRTIQASNPNYSGTAVLSGLTSGAKGFGVNDIAGSAVLLLLPASGEGANKTLYITGTATCPTTDPSAPVTCYQTAWGTLGGTGGAGATFFSSTTDAGPSNSGTETTVIGTVVGSKTIAANTFVDGTVLKLAASGYFSTPAVADSLVLKTYCGATVLGTATLTLSAGVLANGVWRQDSTITARGSGASGAFMLNTIVEFTGSALAPSETKILNTSAVAYDFTTSCVLDIKATWGAAQAGEVIKGSNVAAWIPGAPVTSVTINSGSPNVGAVNLAVTDATITTTDITTNNASTSKHGFIAKLDNNPLHFYNGQGGWTTPAGGGGSGCIPAGSATQILTDDGAGGCTSNTPTISGGNVSATNHFASDSVRTTNYFYWVSGSTIYSPSDGIIRLTNGATDNFNYLCFGSCTSSFPSLKRSGTGLVVRLADDSANAPLTASTVLGSTSITDSGLTAGRVTFAGTAGILSDDADLTFATDTLTATKIVGSTSITDSGLTATRVTFAGASGLLADDADMTFATDTLTVTKVVASTSLTVAGAAITNNVVQNSQSTAYTTVLSDAGKHLYHPGADTTARTFTIDSNANVAYPIGTTLTFVNDTSGGVITIAITSDTLVLAGAGTTGSRTLAANGIATAIKVTATRWIINGTGLT